MIQYHPHPLGALFIVLFLFISFSSHSQVMILSVENDLQCEEFDFEYSNCIVNSSPDGWLNYVLTPDCASARGSAMYPDDVNDEVVVFGEAIKRNISSLGLVAGTTVTLSITVGVGNVYSNYSGFPVFTIFSGNSTLNVKFYNSDPGYSSTFGSIYYDSGQLGLSGTNNTLDGIEFTNTITLTQDANWIAIGNCSEAILYDEWGGNVFDDLKICW